MMDYHKPQIIDLFAGAGGFSLGAMRAGFQLAVAVDFDERAITTHRINFPNTKHLLADISELDGETLLNHAGVSIGDLAGLVGGPPCQGFSVIGQRDASDPRNRLFAKFFDLVRECRPKFYVAENVLGILSEKHTAVIQETSRAIEGDYVSLPPLKLRASEFGAPTSRERVFFIGYRSDIVGSLVVEDFYARKVEEITTVSMALRGLPSNVDETWQTEAVSWQHVEPLPDSFFWDRVKSHVPEGVGNANALRRYREESLVSGCLGTRHTEEVASRYRSLAPGECDAISKAIRLEPGGLCPTLRAGTGPERGSYQAVRPIHPTFPRVITPREAARLQGFPDWFQFPPTKWHSFRQIGNSVSPLVAEVVFKVIKSKLGLF